MTIAVSNAGPLIHLGQINSLDLLFSLFEAVYIPESVHIESVKVGLNQGYPDARYILNEINKGRIIVKNVTKEDLQEMKSRYLHEGEIDAIALAIKLKSDVILLDDEEARIFASAYELKVMGTVGVVIGNFKKGYLPLRTAKQILKNLSHLMYLSSDVYSSALEKLSGT